METGRVPWPRWHLPIFTIGAAHKRFLFSKKWSEPVCFNQILRNLAWKLITKGQSECWAAIPLHEDSRPLTSSRLPMASFPGRGLGSVKITTALPPGKTNWLELVYAARANCRFEFHTPSAFHPHAQRNAFRRHDARPQSRLFVRWNPRLRHCEVLQSFTGRCDSRLR
jgi:hypothetical protein